MSQRKYTVVYTGFNPLSTGHARHPVKSPDIPRRSFNPLSTGHALLLQRYYISTYLVSIPYLRVTHCRRLTPILLMGLVSIPYLRVTHADQAAGYTLIPVFQSPIYGSRTKESQKIPGRMNTFQSPIYGSRTSAK